MASHVDNLLKAYKRHVTLPWTAILAPSQRVWFAIYPKEDERKLRYKVDSFGLTTVEAGKKWLLIDLTNVFSTWMDDQPYRDRYFTTPQALPTKKAAFLKDVSEHVIRLCRDAHVGDDTVIGLLGAASLFGFSHISELVPIVAEKVQGRILVFFPGSRQGNTYRLMDAREGWNYLATAIVAGTTEG